MILNLNSRSQKKRSLKASSQKSMLAPRQFEFLANPLWGRSQTTFTAMGGGGVHQMSTLLNRNGKFY